MVIAIITAELYNISKIGNRGILYFNKLFN